MAINEKLLEILACPLCKTEVKLTAESTKPKLNLIVPLRNK